MRNPNSSRIRSLRPLPVTAPMRAAISCTTISATVMGIMVQSSMWPNWAPAAEYVQMPPASLSTFAVMKPGPTTAKKIRSRIFQRFRKVMRRTHIAAVTDQHKCIQEIWIGEIGETVVVVVGHWPNLNGMSLSQRPNDQRPVSYRLARSRLMMSSEVMTPVSFLLSSTTGRVEQIVLVEEFGDFFLLGRRREWRSAAPGSAKAWPCPEWPARSWPGVRRRPGCRANPPGKSC